MPNTLVPGAAASLAVEARGLVKRFGDVRALDGLDLQVETGSVLGLLGPNGAGKTTAVRVLSTLLTPDDGTATVAGHDVVHDAPGVRAVLGLTGQFAAVDESLTGRENLVWFGRLRGLDADGAARRADELLGRFGLADDGGRLARTYSGGMRRRLDLAVSLMVVPAVLVLDEPTTGLDPRSRLDLWAEVLALKERGVTVLLTTQYLEEADQLADRIVVIDRGRVVEEGTARELKQRVGGAGVDVVAADPDDLAFIASQVSTVAGTDATVDPLAARVSAPVDDGVAAVADLAAALRTAGVAVDDLSLRRPSLDEVFLALTGRPPDEHEAAGPGTTRRGSA